jgi:hypothetical protein
MGAVLGQILTECLAAVGLVAERTARLAFGRACPTYLTIRGSVRVSGNFSSSHFFGSPGIPVVNRKVS